MLIHKEFQLIIVPAQPAKELGKEPFVNVIFIEVECIQRSLGGSNPYSKLERLLS
jgi:hypothetical protein